MPCESKPFGKKRAREGVLLHLHTSGGGGGVLHLIDSRHTRRHPLLQTTPSRSAPSGVARLVSVGYDAPQRGSRGLDHGAKMSVLRVQRPRRRRAVVHVGRRRRRLHHFQFYNQRLWLI
jgi:hypothetical protein